MPAKIYRIHLAPEERKELLKIANCKKTAAGKVTKAKALLLCDESPQGEGLGDEDVCAKTGMASRSLERLRQRCCEVGPLLSLERKVRSTPPRKRIFGGYEQAKLVQLACSDAPEGCAGGLWTCSPRSWSK